MLTQGRSFTTLSTARAIIDRIERAEGREIHYTSMPYDEFYYRLSVRDKFISDILTNRHEVIVDIDHILDNI